MGHLSMKFVPGAWIEEPAIWRQRLRSAHLCQGETLVGACGPYCIFQAILALGIITRSHVSTLRLPSPGRFEDTWEKSKAVFFSGTSLDELVAILRTLESESVRHRVLTGPRRTLFDSVVRRLGRGQVVIFGLDWKTGGGHWVLAIGIEERIEARRRRTTAILCLDSSEPAPRIAPYNTRLELNIKSESARHYIYRESGGTAQVTRCKTAIAIWRH